MCFIGNQIDLINQFLLKNHNLSDRFVRPKIQRERERERERERVNATKNEALAIRSLNAISHSLILGPN